MMDPRIQRAREEQIRLAALLQSGHPESEGIELAISDWFWEEMLVQRGRDRHFMTPSSLGQPAGQVVGEGQERHPGATWANVALKAGYSMRLPYRKEAAKRWPGGRSFDG